MPGSAILSKYRIFFQKIREISVNLDLFKIASKLLFSPLSVLEHSKKIIIY
jgi:hypothetical protein